MKVSLGRSGVFTIGLTVFFLAGSLQAATVMVTATGTFSSYSDPGGLLPFSEPAPGTIFTLTFRYDDQTPDLIHVDPLIGIYRDAVSYTTLTFGSESFTTGSSNITILDDAPNQNDDGHDFGDLWLNLPTVSVVGDFEHEIGLTLVNGGAAPPLSPLTSDALVQPFGPAGWDTFAAIRYRVLETQDGGETLAVATAEATLDSISVQTVPLPGATWLFGSALGVLGWMRRKVN